MSRVGLAIIAMLALVHLSSAARAGGLETGIDRPGGDYRNFDVSADAPDSVCRRGCQSDSRCEAWTLVAAGVQGPRPRCWLKSTAAAPQPCGTCTSGLSGYLEDGIDRPGADYKITDLADPDPTRCLSACSEDRRCVAWTYVNPGVQGPKARCYLKTSVPAAFINACCTSGLPAAAPQ